MEYKYAKMDHIWGTLYLGAYEATVDRQELRDRNITTILTVLGIQVMPEHRHPDIAYHWINAEDRETQDLLTYFPETYALIDACIDAKEGVLVHCGAGISRSTTIVASYLMRKLRSPFKDTMTLIESKRGIIQPNEAFIEQLILYEELGYRLVATDRRLRQYLHRLYLKYDFSQLNQYWQRLEVVEKGTDGFNLGQPYVCSDCGQKLFNDIHVLKNDGSAQYRDLDVCGRVFIEPQPWMSDQLAVFDETAHELEIKCTHCRQVVAKCGTMVSNYKPLVMTINCNCLHHKDVTGLQLMMLDNRFM
ncbi:unnamed protein product [Medioppia subpectinata]|uniref:protein-tyrosine-phosphatase n=1 Tax=Medioppia subpectinata TaxID=1979941 RepID=A0A7R9KC61_9ACAR|nr:unnamed protein product [Medioppia subpectinata]CAG2100485.1 unnamed protein product [Medioppia subpectinata]